MAEFGWDDEVANSAAPKYGWDDEVPSRAPPSSSTITPGQSAALAGANMAGLQLGPRVLALGDASDAVTGPRASEEVTDFGSAVDRIKGVYGRNLDFAGKMLTEPGKTIETASAAYDEALPKYQRGFREAFDANPKASLGGAVVGGLAAGPKSLGQAVVGGMASMAGGTEADYGKAFSGDMGEAGEAALDVGIGGVASLGGYGLGKGAGWLAGQVGRPIAALANRAQRGIGDAVAEETAKQTAKADKEIGSLLGKYRSGISNASRDLEVMERAAADPNLPSSQAARTFLASAEGIALRESVLGTKLTTAPERIAEMVDAKGAFQTASGARASTIAKGTEEALSRPFNKQVRPRVATVASRLVPPMVGSFVGNEIGGVEGALAGGAIGGGLAMVMGRPGTVMANMMKSPAVKKMAWEGVAKLAKANPAALGKFGGLLGSAAARGEQALSATHYVLAQQFPEYRELLATMFGEDRGDEVARASAD